MVFIIFYYFAFLGGLFEVKAKWDQFFVQYKVTTLFIDQWTYFKHGTKQSGTNEYYINRPSLNDALFIRKLMK